MSCCGGNCGCGADCKCQGCNGCSMYPDLGSSETVIVGFTQVKTAGFEEAAEMSFGAENGCKCGSNCSCTNCSC